MAIETRVHVTPELYPEGLDNRQLPRAFRLEIRTEHQRRDGRSRGWLNTEPATRATAAEGLTRDQVAAFITQAAELLAWDGTDG